MKINSVHLVTISQMESKKTTKKNKLFSPSPFQTITIGKFTKQPKLLFSKFNFFVIFSDYLSVCLSVYLSIYLSVYLSIHPSTPAPIFKALFEYLVYNQRRFLEHLIFADYRRTCIYTVLRLRASLFWRVGFGNCQKILKNDKEFHYITVKSKTLICHFNQNTPVRPSVHPSLLDTKW